MSVFSPLDPRGPDQRRKQLIAKLAQQAGAAHSAVSRVPMPGRMGPQMSEGAAFRGAGNVRLGGRASVTQAPNILQSVLSRLGVLGHSHAEEASAGRGLPIAPPAPSHGMPIPPAGSAIPTPSGPTGPSAPSNPDVFNATEAGQQVGSAYSITTPGGPGLVDPGFITADSGPVPLGNGLFYDPATGTILGTQDAGVAGAGVRALPGRNIAA